MHVHIVVRYGVAACDSTAMAAVVKSLSSSTDLGAPQTGESWNTVVRPKALGAWNLDAATRGLAALEHFVCFSSVVATLGNAGAPQACLLLCPGIC